MSHLDEINADAEVIRLHSLENSGKSCYCGRWSAERSYREHLAVEIGAARYKRDVISLDVEEFKNFVLSNPRIDANVYSMLNEYFEGARNA